jgi:hypothetical protein
MSEAVELVVRMALVTARAVECRPRIDTVFGPAIRSPGIRLNQEVGDAKRGDDIGRGRGVYANGRSTACRRGVQRRGRV